MREIAERPETREFMEFVDAFGRKMQSHPEGEPERMELQVARNTLEGAILSMHDEARALESTLRDALAVIERVLDGGGLANRPNTEGLAFGVLAKAKRLCITGEGATHRHWDDE